MPIGAESEFKGVIDLVEMKAHIWPDESGERWETTEIPDEFAEQAAGNGQDIGGLKVKKTQLQAVQKTIHQLERKGIPVPTG